MPGCDAISIGRESPLAPDLRHLMARHTADMIADTPPESIHMMDENELSVSEVSFHVMRDDGVPVGMGALRRIDVAHAEIKSMHILSEHRGKGLSRRMLAYLLAEARTSGYRRLSLETGIQTTFIAARALYARSGFIECPPFDAYRPDPNSVFMTTNL